MIRISFLLLLFFSACTRNEIPKDIMPPEKMQSVLYDVILADELADFSSMNDSTFRGLEKRTLLYDSIFKTHRITKQRFQASLKFYQGRPDLLRTILDSLLTKSDTIPRSKAAAQ